MVVLADAVVQKIESFELWNAFGTGKNLNHYVPGHELCALLGLQKSMAMPVFHAFTRCDTLS